MDFMFLIHFLFPVADPEVSCVFRQNCLLPCQIQFNSDLVIHWSNASSAGDSVVHSYYDGQDQLGQQNQNFKDRTSLIQDQISRGNASLLLKEVKIQDEGRYKCNTSTSTGHKESFINLKIDGRNVLLNIFNIFQLLFFAPVSTIRIHQDGNRITCSSEGIYPPPELTWSTEPPSNTALPTRTTVHQTEEKLYDISSSLTVPDGSDRIYIKLLFSFQFPLNISLVPKKPIHAFISCPCFIATGVTRRRTKRRMRRRTQRRTKRRRRTQKKENQNHLDILVKR
uniref:Ig-like domain-containing protein n=1 Tax=Xiphophorus maculatus TaxID=8083 RepID=A0A3B5QRM2_XIPMA